MNRRDFLWRSGAISLATGLPLGVATARMARPGVLEDPHAWVGAEFEAADGRRLRLVAVTDLRLDRHALQARLQFEMVQGIPLPEGCHQLQSTGRLETLFLQPGQRGPVACINRLHRSLA